jgi:hypothetical protein
MQTMTGHKHRTIPELSIARLASHTRPANINIDFQFERLFLLIDITDTRIRHDQYSKLPVSQRTNCKQITRR